MIWALMVTACLAAADGRPDYASCETARWRASFRAEASCLALAADPRFRRAVGQVTDLWRLRHGAPHALPPQLTCREAPREA